VDADGVTPAHHLFSAQAIRKAAAAGDLSAARLHITGDAFVTDAPNDSTRTVKTSRPQRGNLRSAVGNDQDEVTTVNMEVKTYRTNGNRRDRVGNHTANDQGLAVHSEDHTAIRRGQHGVIGRTDQTNLVMGGQFGENQYAERHAGGLGGKYTWHLADREHEMREDVGDS